MQAPLPALSGGAAGLLAGVVGGQLADSVGYRGLFGSLALVTLAGSAVGGVELLRARRRADGAAERAPAPAPEATRAPAGRPDA